MYRALITSAVVPLALGDYAYSYDYTNTPTATFAPTRTETYAPTRMTDAPSYAPTTDTYAPTFGSCPPIGAPDTCPVDATGLPLCNAVGLATGDKCITSLRICPDLQEPTKCPAFHGRRRLHGSNVRRRRMHAAVVQRHLRRLPAVSVIPIN